MKSPKEKIAEKISEKHINRTGIALSPKLSKEMIEGALETEPSMAGDESGIAEVREAYAKHADPVGSIPPPATLKGAAKTAMKALEGERASVLLDKIGERMQFERTGTRLYEALLSKFDAAPAMPNGPTRARLEEIYAEEEQHFVMLREAMVQMGGDPTAVTPSADVAGVLSMGVPQVLLDARTTFPQSLEAILLAELADNDGWTLLIQLARELGQDELAHRFGVALAEEEEHLRDVRAWVTAATMQRAGAKVVTKAKPKNGGAAQLR